MPATQQPTPVLAPAPRRGRSYLLVGILLALGLAIVWFSGFTGIQGPGLFSATTAIFLLGIGLSLTAVAVVYFLWTFPRTVRHSEARMDRRLAQHMASGHPGVHPKTNPGPKSITLPAVVEKSRPPTSRVELPPFPEAQAQPVFAGRVARLRRARRSPSAVSSPTRSRRGRRSPTEQRPVIDIEGIGPKFAHRLNREGILTVGDLKNAQPDYVASRVHASATNVRNWQSMGQLMEVDKVGPQYAELLVRADIHSVEQLAASRPPTLLSQLKKVQRGRKVPIQRGPVSLPLVRVWVRSASQHLRRAGITVTRSRSARMTVHSH